MMKHTLAFAALLHCCTAQITDGEVHRNCGILPWLFGKDCTPYSLHSYPSFEVDRHLIIGNQGNMPPEMPSTLHGLFFMDGNPLQDEVVSFANCRWSAEDNSCYQKVYGSRIWGWTNTKGGEVLYKAVHNFELVYRIQLNAAKNFVNIFPNVFIVPEISQQLVDFDAYYVEDGLGGKWVRNSTVVSQPLTGGTYNFRRIVYGNGTRAANWDEFYVPALNAPEKTLIETQFYAQAQQ